MKLVTDNAFTKAWEISCPTCRIDQPHSMLWFKKQCHECEIKVVADKKYTEEDLLHAFREGVLLPNSQIGIMEDIFKQVVQSLNKQD